MKNRQLMALVLSVFALSVSMLNLGLLISKHYYKPQIVKLEKQIEQLQTRKTTVIYQVDNNGANLVGVVTDKAVVDGYYTITIGAYGKFLVTKEQYEAIKVGDPAPEYLKMRGG